MDEYICRRCGRPLDAGHDDQGRCEDRMDYSPAMGMSDAHPVALYCEWVRQWEIAGKAEDDAKQALQRYERCLGIQRAENRATQQENERTDERMCSHDGQV